MESGWNTLKLKPKAELERQIDDSSAILGTNISPESKREEILRMSEHELKERYPARYAQYIDILKKNKRGHQPTEPELAHARSLINSLNSLDRYISEYQEKGGVLRDKQATVFEDLRDAIERGTTKGYVVLPTGVGKTVLFIEFVRAFNAPTLIVVPTQTLLHQTGRKLEQFAPEMEYGKVYAYAKEHDSQVTITTYDSLVAGLQNGTINPQNYQAVILDEVHESLSLTRAKAIGQFKDALIVGFTATPEYSRSKKVGDLLEHEIHRMGIKEAIEGNLLSPLSCVVAQIEVDLSGVSINETGEYDSGQLIELLRVHAINKACVDIYRQGFTGKQAIVFAGNIAHAEEVKNEFTKQGISCECLHGGQSEQEREKIVEAYENKQIDVLVGVDLLTRGFDAPRASVCLNLVPTFSLVRATQRGGRVLRIDETDPSKHAQIIDFLYRDGREGKTPILFAQVVGDSVVLSPGKEGKTNGGAPNKIGSLNEPQSPQLPPFDIEGVKVITSSKEVLRITNELMGKNKEIGFAPEGWVTCGQLFKKLGVSYSRVFEIAQEYIGDEKMVRDYKSLNGGTHGFYSEKLIEIITKRLTGGKQAPEGWVNNSELVRRLGVARMTVSLTAQEYIGTEDMMVSKYKSPNLGGRGRSIDYYSPPLVEAITSKLAGAGFAPKGWATEGRLVKNLKVNGYTIRKIIQEFGHDIGEVREYKDVGGVMHKHYSPKSVALITEKATAAQYPPEDWVRVGILSQLFNVSNDTILKITEKYANNKNLLKEYRNKDGRLSRHYSPDIVNIIATELETRKQK